ncbi:hypothetical protein BOX15_Mlig012608g1 [Macrostomum lignano]|uniref:Uncharacterized protein n=1 Tax=Macrostomum lignano TaxID=282301 RepID=A0A267F6G3_9PLAT|nr:hypothetical protein BOX15_Mlig012608g1 [Macrostomum lignano]
MQADGSRRLNLRKLSELPYHLVRSGRIEEFHREVTFNVVHLEARLTSSSRYQLMRDLRLFLDLDESKKGDWNAAVDAERVFNAIRVASLSLGHSSLALAVDLCGRLRHFAEESRNIQRLLNGCRDDNASTARILLLNSCFDSGSSFTQCTVQVQLALGMLCESGQIYAVSLDDRLDGTVWWFDLEGNELKKIECQSPVLLHIHLRHMRTLQPSGCYLSIAKEDPNDNKTYKIFKTNLHTGAWRVVMDSLPGEIALAAAESGDNLVYAASDKHLVIRKKTLESASRTHFYLLRPEPLHLVRFLASESRWEGPILNGDQFLFFVGHSELFSNHDATGPPAHVPRLLILDKFCTEVKLDCPELTERVLNSQFQSFCPFVLHERLLIITRTEGPEDSSHSLVFSVHCFTVDSKEVHKSAFWKLIRPATDANHEFSIVLSADGGTAALMFRSPVQSGMGFVCNLCDGSSALLAYHPVLEETHNLDQDDSKEIAPLMDSLFISSNGDLLLSKGRSGCMLNLWSARDGSFLRTLTGNSEFYSLGQPSGTDFLAINLLPDESVANDSWVHLKILKLSALQASIGDFDKAKISTKMIKQGLFAYRPGQSGKMISSFYDQQVNQGQAVEVDFGTGRSRIVIDIRGKDSSNASDAMGVFAEEDEDNYLKGSEKAEESKPEDNTADDFVKHLDPFLKDYNQNWDELKCVNLVLVQDPRYLGMRLVDSESTTLTNGTLFDVDSNSIDPSRTELTVIITNHPQFTSLPVGYLLAKDEHRPPMFDEASDYFGVLSSDKGQMFLLLKKTVQILCADLLTRRIERLKAPQLPSKLPIGEAFLSYATRRAAVEAMRAAASDLAQADARFDLAVATDGGSQGELELNKFAISQARELLRLKIAEYLESSVDQESGAPLAAEIVPKLSELLTQAAGGDSSKVSAAMLCLAQNGLQLVLQFSLKLKHDDHCQPEMLFARPGHLGHVIVQYRCVGIESYTRALHREVMCWPGQLVTYDVNLGVVSVSKTFDSGILCLLPDGERCVTYRMKIVSVQTGETVRDLDPTNAVVLKDMLLTMDGSVLIGRRLALGQRWSDRDQEDETEEDLMQDGQRILQAFSLLDGSLLFNYLFEEEPVLLMSPSPNRLVVLLRDHPVQVYEILQAKHTDSHQALLNNRNPKPINDYLQRDYLSYVRAVLSRGLARVADARPADPIEFLAHWLLLMKGADA